MKETISNTNLALAHRRSASKKVGVLSALLFALILCFFVCLFVGSSHMGFAEGWKALFGQSTNANNQIIRGIRLPRVIAAVLAGASLSLSGLLMQTTLGNVMASPSTLGVSNAAVFGANLSIIAFAGGFLSTGHNVDNYFVNANPYQTSWMAFAFALLSVLLILGLCKLRSFSPNAVILAGIAIGAIWTAATTILQFYATDVGLSAAVIWSFGDLGRASYKTDLILLVVLLVGLVFSWICSWRYNALLSGDASARSVGIRVGLLRFLSLLVASLMTAVVVSFLGVIGFVGVICPHAMKRILGHDHRFLIPASVLSGSVLLLLADTLSRSIGNGSALPVGAITSLLGAPFFLFLIFSKKGERKC